MKGRSMQVPIDRKAAQPPGKLTDHEGCDRGDYGREPGVKKGALGLEDQGQVPPELQEKVHAEVELARDRSGWSVKRTLKTSRNPSC